MALVTRVSTARPDQIMVVEDLYVKITDHHPDRIAVPCMMLP
jgi:hypothetical protein